jgi:hypothetical protein
MDYDLTALFAEAKVTTTDIQGQEPLLAAQESAATMSQDICELGGVAVPEGESSISLDSAHGLLFGMEISTYAEDTIKSLLRDRNYFQKEFSRYKKAYEDLERRVYKNAISDVNLPADLTRRLHRLENDLERQQANNKQLRQRLKISESEVTTLQGEIAGQKNKTKGADKKVRNAKDFADKSEEKARHAVLDKQLRISSERQVKNERNEAFAKVASLTRMCDELQSDLQEETSGKPHLRKISTSSDEAIAVIPIELTILRKHFVSLVPVFESYQIGITEEMQRWYDGWRKSKDTTQEVVGATYIHTEQSGESAPSLGKLYGDMIELVDGHQQTGAEHNGPRSKRSLETTCRKTGERHNNQD